MLRWIEHQSVVPIRSAQYHSSRASASEALPQTNKVYTSKIIKNSVWSECDRIAIATDRSAVRWSESDKSAGPNLSLSWNVSAIIREYVTLQVESVDRMYLNL
jgi:hypothetical protein